MFEVQPIPAFEDNYIWALRGETPDQVAVVDPGDADVVFKFLRENRLNLAAILITHHHWDHTGGVERLVERYSVPVFGPADSPFGGITKPLEDGAEFQLLGNRLEVRSVPAHTLDHIAYFQPDGTPQLFCGDTLFLAGCGRLFEGTAEQMQRAMDYFAALPSQTAVYCTHEYSLANLHFALKVERENPAIVKELERCTELRQLGKPTLPSRIEIEREINPYMRTRESSVKRAAELYSGQTLETEIDVLAAVRSWKNSS